MFLADMGQILWRFDPIFRKKSQKRPPLGIRFRAQVKPFRIGYFGPVEFFFIRRIRCKRSTIRFRFCGAQICFGRLSNPRQTGILSPDAQTVENDYHQRGD
jgi:hypothetical protein